MMCRFQSTGGTRFVQHLFFFIFRYNYMYYLLLSKLLGITIQHEKPQLEVQKTELLRKEEELKVQLAVLEESLLEVCTIIILFYTFITSLIKW